MAKSKTQAHVHKTLRVDQDLYEKIEDYMNENEKTFTEVVLTALESFISDFDIIKSPKQKKDEIIRLLSDLEVSDSSEMAIRIKPDRETQPMDPKEHAETEEMHRAEMKRLEKEAEVSGHKPIPTTKIRRTQGTPRSPSMGKKKQA